VRFASLGGEQLFVPAGFAHGFCTLVGETEVFYKVDAIYSPAHDAGSIGWIQLSIFPGRSTGVRQSCRTRIKRFQA
jgi:dTDP-4-dehydrorhamnose 3,5-epimerase